MLLVRLSKSNVENKRYRAQIIGEGGKVIRTVQFGAKNGQTFMDHGDEAKRAAWIARHSKLGEDWSRQGIYTPGFWSRHLLWSRKGLYESIKYMKDIFNIKIVLGGHPN